MKVAVTGASGVIGSALVDHLRARGDDVVRLVRRAVSAPDEVRWDPTTGDVDLAALQGVDAVVHLAAAGVGDHRWTPAYKREILDSRVLGTTTISRAVAALDPPPSVLVSGSAMGIYGDTADVAVDEHAPAASGFLSDVVVQWEATTGPARDAGIRVAHARTGIVLTRAGGALRRQLPFFRLGLGGRLASGRQYWSFISIVDEVRAIAFLLDSPTLAGPVNLTAPNPVTNAEVTAALARVLHRPAVLPVPRFALRIVLGELSSDVLMSLRVIPRVLLDSGFTFEHPTIEDALRAMV